MCLGLGLGVVLVLKLVGSVSLRYTKRLCTKRLGREMSGVFHTRCNQTDLNLAYLEVTVKVE